MQNGGDFQVRTRGGVVMKISGEMSANIQGLLVETKAIKELPRRSIGELLVFYFLLSA